MPRQFLPKVIIWVGARATQEFPQCLSGLDPTRLVVLVPKTLVRRVYFAYGLWRLYFLCKYYVCLGNLTWWRKWNRALDETAYTHFQLRIFLSLFFSLMEFSMNKTFHFSCLQFRTLLCKYIHFAYLSDVLQWKEYFEYLNIAHWKCFDYWASKIE